MDDIRKKLALKNQELIVLRLPDELIKDFSRERNWTRYDEMPDLSPEALLAFAKNREELAMVLQEVLPHINPAAKLWFAYPRKNSERYKTDINREEGWEALQKRNFQPARQVALGEDWQALGFRHA